MHPSGLYSQLACSRRKIQMPLPWQRVYTGWTKDCFKRLYAFASSQSKETCTPIEIYLVYGRHQFLSVPGTHVYGRITYVLLPPHRSRCILGHKRPGISGAFRGDFTEPAQTECPFDGHNGMVSHVSRICNGFL